MKVRGLVSEPSHSARFGEIKPGEFEMPDAHVEGAAAAGLVEVVALPAPPVSRPIPRPTWKVTPPAQEQTPEEGQEESAPRGGRK